LIEVTSQLQCKRWCILLVENHRTREQPMDNDGQLTGHPYEQDDL